MKVTVVSIQDPIKITVVNLANPVIKIYTTGVQGKDGPVGPGGGFIIDETTQDLTITDETYLVLKGDDLLNITLKDPTSAVPVTIINQSAGPATIIGSILGDTSFIIAPGNVYQFVPSEGQYYVA